LIAWHRPWLLKIELTPDEADWVTVEIRDNSGAMLAMTNPIFL